MFLKFWEKRGRMYKSFRTLEDFNLRNKVVLLRVDLNSELKNKKPVMSDRIRFHSQTINSLKKKGARIVILAHQGRPGKEFTSLKEHSRLLNKFTKTRFVDDICGSKAIKAINGLKNGEAVLLENVRGIKAEFNMDKNSEYVRVLSDICDIYINDALSISHRAQTSIVVFPKLMPHCIGSVMETELKNIDKINLKNSLFILSGAKTEDNMILINKKHILSGGVFALICLMAKGYNLGLETKRLKSYKKFFGKIKKNKGIKNPLDVAYEMNGKRKECGLSDLPVNHRIYDLGKKTIELYENEIMKAKTIFWKGPVGYTEIKGFELGTKRLLKAMEKSKAFGVVSGGHSTTAIEKFKINKKKIGYVSLSGGALIHYISGKKLPGLEALK